MRDVAPVASRRIVFWDVQNGSLRRFWAFSYSSPLPKPLQSRLAPSSTRFFLRLAAPPPAPAAPPPPVVEAPVESYFDGIDMANFLEDEPPAKRVRP